jgi:AcrR family transcriptional regulator
MNGYEKRTLQKKQDIVLAAQKLFSQRGITDVSVTDIAAEAGVSRVTLFKYFGDKESLAKEAMLEWVQRLVGEYEQVLYGELPFHEKLLALLDTRMAGRRRIGDPFIQSAAWGDPQLSALIGQMLSPRILPMILRLIGEGKSAGKIDRGLEDEAILAYLGAFGAMAKDPAYITKGETFHKSIFHLVLGGLIRDWHSGTEA